jgi:hypothetical protein
MVAEAPPPGRPERDFLRLFVLLTFMAGGVFLALADSSSDGKLFGVLGILAAIVGACMSISFGSKDHKWAFDQLATGSAFILCAFMTGDPVCIPLLGIMFLIYIAVIASKRDISHPLAMVLFMPLAWIISSFLIRFLFLPDTPDGTYVISDWFGRERRIPLDLLKAQIVMCIGLVTATTATFIAIQIRALKKIRQAEERKFFVDRHDGKHGNA